MGKLNYTNRKVEGLKLGQIICKDLLKRIPPGTGTKAAQRDPVVELSVAQKTLTDEGALEVINGLQASLSYRAPEGDSPAGSGQAKTSLTRLEELCFAGAKLTVQTLRALGEVIELASGDLQDLDLSDNEISVSTAEEAEAWEIFLRSFQHCRVLRRLDLSGNPLGLRAFEIFARTYMREEPLDVAAALEESIDDSDETHFGEPVLAEAGNQAELGRRRRMSRIGAGENKDPSAPQSISNLARLRRGSNKASTVPEPEFGKLSIGEKNEASYAALQGLRSIPYVVLVGTRMTDSCALHLSYLLDSHHLPHNLLMCVPPARQGSASHQLEAYDASAGCRGVIYLPNDEMTHVGIQILEECEKARQYLLGTGEAQGPTKGKAKMSDFAPRSSGGRRVNPSPGGAAIASDGVLERLRKKAQANTIKEFGVNSLEIWRTAFRLLTVSRSLLLKDQHAQPRRVISQPKQEVEKTQAELTQEESAQEEDSHEENLQGERAQREKTRQKPQSSTPKWVKLSLADIMAEQTAMTFGVIESSPSNFGKTPPPAARQKSGRRPSESSTPRGHALLGGGPSDSPVSLRSINGLTRRLALCGGLPKELWCRILIQAIDPQGLLHEDQYHAVLTFAWSKETLHREREIAGKPESGQIWHVLEAMDCLVYRGKE